MIQELMECFISDGDLHVELAMLYKQHFEKYPHFAITVDIFNMFITKHTVDIP